jgi:hypothetical protein
MLEYLDTNGSDNDFILESDTDDTSEQEDAPHATTPAAHCVPDSEEDDMDDEDYRKFHHLSNLFLSNSKNCLDLSICLLLIPPYCLCLSLLHRLDPYPHGDSPPDMCSK